MAQFIKGSQMYNQATAKKIDWNAKQFTPDKEIIFIKILDGAHTL